MTIIASFFSVYIEFITNKKLILVIYISSLNNMMKCILIIVKLIYTMMNFFVLSIKKLNIMLTKIYHCKYNLLVIFLNI